MFTIIGVDPAKTRLAAVVSRGDDFEVVERKKMPVDMKECLEIAGEWMAEIVEASPRPVAVFIEIPMVGRGGVQVALKLGMIHGAMVSAAMRAGADIVMQVGVTEWKKRIIGNGSASKPQVASHIKRYWRDLYDEANGSQDVIDAGAINLHGRTTLRARKMVRAGKTLR